VVRLRVAATGVAVEAAVRLKVAVTAVVVEVAAEALAHRRHQLLDGRTEESC
jgi:hypothetical protein